MSTDGPQMWELWYPDAAATGLPFARARIEAAGVIWVHAAPPSLAVTVRAGDGVVARTPSGEPALRTGPRTPMTRLEIRDGAILREDRWPGPGDIGSVVVLPGGEAGVLKSWWNADDESEWRWTVEFYNHT